jgi:hypothetical protein
MDPTKVDIKSCYVYMPQLDWKPKTFDNETGEYDLQPETEYKITMIFCWGTAIKIEDTTTALKYEGYYDKGWCFSPERLSWKKMNETIIKILESETIQNI